MDNNHHYLPIQDSLEKDLTLSRPLIEETEKPHSRRLVHLPTGFKSAMTRLMRVHKDVGVPVRMESVQYPLLSHQALTTQYCRERNN